MSSYDPGQSSSSTLTGLLMAQPPVRTALTALFNHYSVAGAGSGSSAALTLNGWLAFLEAFDVCPGYLSMERVEEVFEEAARSVGRTPRGRAAARAASSALAFSEFQEAVCHLASAFVEKQWKVEYSAEKAARYRYKLKDAEKGRVEPGPEESLEALLTALDLGDPAEYRKRAGMPPSSPPRPAAVSSAVAATGEAADAAAAAKWGVQKGDSPSALEAKLRSLRLAIAAGDDDCSALGSLLLGGELGGGDTASESSSSSSSSSSASSLSDHGGPAAGRRTAPSSVSTVAAIRGVTSS